MLTTLNPRELIVGCEAVLDFGYVFRRLKMSHNENDKHIVSNIARQFHP
jgi:hypothetical protein